MGWRKPHCHDMCSTPHIWSLQGIQFNQSSGHLQFSASIYLYHSTLYARRPRPHGIPTNPRWLLETPPPGMLLIWFSRVHGIPAWQAAFASTQSHKVLSASGSKPPNFIFTSFNLKANLHIVFAHFAFLVVSSLLHFLFLCSCVTVSIPTQGTDFHYPAPVNSFFIPAFQPCVTSHSLPCASIRAGIVIGCFGSRGVVSSPR